MQRWNEGQGQGDVKLRPVYFLLPSRQIKVTHLWGADVSFHCCLFSDASLYHQLLVPVVGVVVFCSPPPHVGIVSVLFGTVHVAFGLRGAAHKLHTSEAVNATGQQHPVVVEVHGAVSAGLKTQRKP